MLPPDADLNLLLGGGIDSAALIAFYLSRGTTVRGFHFNYNQPSFEGENRAVLALAQHYNISLTTIDLGLKLPALKENTIVATQHYCLQLPAFFLLSRADLL
jgi:7-cyano-7-deazaguanine synthase in queuosine biosynthesis